MEYIRWKEDLTVGINSIDDQHKELFRLINAFYNSIINKSNKEGVSQVIKDLEDYIIVHFNAEETLMRASNYTGYASHKAEHEKFIETVANYRKRHDEGRLLLSLEVTNFIKNWITDHIMKTDHLYKGKLLAG